MELWKEHPELLGVWVSSGGLVRRRINETHPEREKQWHYFCPNVNVDRSGYTSVRVSIRRKNYVVARLVAETFLSLLPGQIVRHKNNDPLDNRLSNLDTGTQKENMRDKAKHETWQGGHTHPKCKYDDVIVGSVQRDIALHGKTRGFAKKLSQKYSIPVHVVYDISYGRRKTYLQRLDDAKCEYSDAM